MPRYSRPIRALVATALAILALAGCESGGSERHAKTVAERSSTVPAVLVRPHPHVVEPVTGRSSAKPANSGGRASGPAAPSPTPSLSRPATITRAPARGAPSDAQVRAAAVSFQLAVARYHLNRVDVSTALLDPAQLPGGQYNVSVASVFTAYGHGVACGGILRVGTLGVANKTLPCGTEVIFRYGHRAIRVPVIDRGPYIAGREWDLTGGAAEALRFPGLGAIDWRLAS